MLKYAIGLDISSKDIHACFGTIDALQKVVFKASRKFSNQEDGFTMLELWLLKLHKEKDIPLIICMEATGVYYEKCALWLFQKGYSVSVVLPNKSKKYMQALGIKSKNDRIDAQGLCRMTAEQAMDQWVPAEDYFYQLRSLTRQLQALQELKTNISNQLHADMHGMYQNILVIGQFGQLLNTIQLQIEDMIGAIASHIASRETIAQKVDNICRIKGLGILTVAVILAETNGFLLFKNSRQLISFAGYDVVENQSGNFRGKSRISKKGNSHLRRCLHMPAFSVVKYEQSPFVQLFERTLLRHRIKMKSYVAVQRKLLSIIFALWKKNGAYDQAYSPAINVQHIIT